MGRGYAELGAGWTRVRGGYAFGELGAHVTSQLTAFGRLEADSADMGAMAGLKWEW